MIVCFGSINVDLIFPVPALPRVDDAVLGRVMHVEPGGKGAIQALAAAKDGATVALAGAVGMDALSDQAVSLLRIAGADLSRVVRADISTGCAAIAVDPQGHYQVSLAAGANLMAKAEQVEGALLVPGTTLLVQAETDLDETALLVRRARAGGARVIINLAPIAPFPEAALRTADILVVNEEEAAWLAARINAKPDAASLHAALGVDVIRTRGGDGVDAVTREGSYRLPAHPVPVVDTTGAGDCFVGVLAAALDRGLPFAQALRRANVAAALSCGRAGTQGSVPSAAETDAALAI